MSEGTEVIGYVLVAPNTHAMDWDGVIHETKDSAIRELFQAGLLRDQDTERPFDTADLPYYVAEVRLAAADQDKALKAMQREWDAHRAWLAEG